MKKTKTVTGAMRNTGVCKYKKKKILKKVTKKLGKMIYFHYTCIKSLWKK